MAHAPARYVVCSLCAKPIELKTANTDEKGQAVHEDCYVGYISVQSRILLSTSRGLLVLGTLTSASEAKTSLSRLSQVAIRSLQGPHAILASTPLPKLVCRAADGCAYGKSSRVSTAGGG